MYSSKLNEGPSSFKFYSRSGLQIAGCCHLRCCALVITFWTLLFAGLSRPPTAVVEEGYKLKVAGCKLAGITEGVWQDTANATT